MPLFLALALVLASASVAKAQPRQPFDAWLSDLLTEARARGDGRRDIYWEAAVAIYSMVD
jgi:hypothetical protein